MDPSFISRRNAVEVVTMQPQYSTDYTTTTSKFMRQTQYLTRMRNKPNYVISSFPNRLAVNFRHTLYFYVVKIKTVSILIWLAIQVVFASRASAGARNLIVSPSF